MLYCLIGPPGSGKTTQAKLLAESLDIPFVSMSKELRNATSSDPELNIAIQKGNLAPDEFVFKIVKKTLEDNADVVIDGLPRTPAQADFLVDLAEHHKITVFFLALSDEVSQKRLNQRAIADPNERLDDTPEIITERLQNFRQFERSIRAKLAQSTIQTIEINGEQSVGDIHSEVTRKLQEHNESNP